MYKIIFFIWASAVASINCAATQERELLSPDMQTSMHSSIINPITPHLVFGDSEQAKAWLDDMSNRLKKWEPDEFLRKRYLTTIQYEAMRADLDPQIVLSVITIESKFNKYAISPAGARGLMQVMPFWQTLIGIKEHSLLDVQTNLRYGCTILRHYLKRENGNLIKALARYNGSVGKLGYPKLVMDAYNSYWQPYPVAIIKNNKLTYITY
jgi:soluble lytic murein transglycosylase-like protein